jgi:hypothetical protein
VRVPVSGDDLVLEIEESVFDRGWQPGLTDRAEATEPLPDLVARLADHLGDAALFRVVLADRLRPEAAWSPAPFPPPALVEAAPSDPEGPRVARPGGNPGRMGGYRPVPAPHGVAAQTSSGGRVV